jgi:hypothetical protein
VKQLQYNQFHRQFDLICKIDFSNQCISDKKLELFCSAVKNQQQLFQLNLSKNEISDKGIYHFSSTVLRSLSSLKMLDLSWNLLTDCSIRILADLDYYSSSLEQLNLSFNHLTSLSAYYLSLFYTKDFHCSIKRLVLGGTHNKGNLHSSTAWGNEYLKIFVGRLLTSEVGRLEELTLNAFNITDDQGKASEDNGFDYLLVLLFANNNRIKLLDISNNFIESSSYRSFFLKAIQLLTHRREQQYLQHKAYLDSLNSVGNETDFSSVRTLQFLAYDCGFSLNEIQHFQSLFFHSEFISSSTLPTLFPDNEGKKLRLPSPLSSSSYLTLQSTVSVNWETCLIVSNKLYFSLYYCLVTANQVTSSLLNNWKSSGPLKFRPPLVATYRQYLISLSAASKSRSSKIKKHLPAVCSDSFLLPFISHQETEEQHLGTSMDEPALRADDHTLGDSVADEHSLSHQQPRKVSLAAKPVTDQKAEDESSQTVATSVSNQTFVYHNESSLLASLSKRLSFPLEKLFHQSSLSLSSVKNSMLLLNDEVNYVHFYQELIGQLSTVDYHHSLSRSKQELNSVFVRLEHFNVIKDYPSFLSLSNRNELLFPLRSDYSRNSFSFENPVFTDEMINFQIEFFLEAQRSSRHCLQVWNNCIDYCLAELEKFFVFVEAQQKDHYRHHRSILPALNSSVKAARNSLLKSSGVAFAPSVTVEQREQLMFMLEDCYSQTVRKGIIDQEYIGALHQQNIIINYIHEKQRILSDLQQRQPAVESERGLSISTSSVSLQQQKKDKIKSTSEKGDSKKSKNRLLDMKKQLGENEKNSRFLSLSFSDYLYYELNMNFEKSLCFLSYFYHYYCFIYQKEKFHV